jgi:hypothetical protein
LSSGLAIPVADVGERTYRPHGVRAGFLNGAIEGREQPVELERQRDRAPLLGLPASAGEAPREEAHVVPAAEGFLRSAKAFERGSEAGRAPEGEVFEHVARRFNGDPISVQFAVRIAVGRIGDRSLGCAAGALKAARGLGLALRFQAPQALDESAHPAPGHRLFRRAGAPGQERVPSGIQACRHIGRQHAELAHARQKLAVHFELPAL